jgi:cell division transport system permease protein
MTTRWWKRTPRRRSGWKAGGWSGMAERRRPLRRSRGRDPLGLRRALADRLLPGLVAAMALLGAVALGGAEGAAELARRWQGGAGSAVLVQLPPDTPPARRDSALAALRALPEVVDAQAMDRERMAALLRPWLGEAPSVPLPLVIELRLASLPASPSGLAARVAAAVPGGGASVEAHGVWLARLAALARSLQGVAMAALLLVAGIAAAVVAVAVRAGLASRRQAIAVLHELGATDADIAGRFARRVALLAGAGALAGTALAVPVLAALAGLAAPLLGAAEAAESWRVPWRDLPWTGLLLLPAIGAAIGWLTAQVAVRRWLRLLP